MTEPSAPPPGPLVLVVDDDEDLLDLEAEALRRWGYRVATAKHGAEALERIEEEEPLVILLDMRMPVMDGWTFAREVRRRYGRRIPVVVATAAEDSRIRAEEVAAEGHLGKPFDITALREVIGAALGRRP